MQIFNHKRGLYFNSNEAKIYYEFLGNKEKPVLVMLHGGFENIEKLNIIASYLNKDFFLIGIDSRGHGRSSLGSDKLTHKQMQSDVENLLKSLNLINVNILGFSDGGTIGYKIASSNKINVNKLITIGASWRNEDVDESEEILRSITSESAKEIFVDKFKTYQKLNPEPNFDKLTKSIVEMWLDKTDTGYPNQDVKNILADTLLIRGDNDFLFSLNSLRILQNNIKNSKLMNIALAEHSVYEEQKEIVKIIIKQFLNI